MRKADAAAVAENQASLPAGGRESSAQVVCLALTLALLVLVSRIASVW